MGLDPPYIAHPSANLLSFAKMLKRYALLFTLCLVAPFAAAQGVMSSAIASLEAGLICPPETVGSAPAPGTLAGTTHIIDQEPPFVANTRRVPAVLGLGFGVKSQSTDRVGLDDVTMVVSHPPMGDRGVTVQEFQTRISGDSPSITFYQFDYAYELVPGTWQMTAMSGETALFSVNFEVVAPRDAMDLAGVCAGLDLLS